MTLQLPIWRRDLTLPQPATPHPACCRWRCARVHLLPANPSARLASAAVSRLPSLLSSVPRACSLVALVTLSYSPVTYSCCQRPPTLTQLLRSLGSTLKSAPAAVSPRAATLLLLYGLFPLFLLSICLRLLLVPKYRVAPPALAAFWKKPQKVPKT